MKYDFQISTGQFEYIKGEVEGTHEDAVMAFKDLKRVYTGGEGVGMKVLSEIILELCTTGGIKNGGDNNYSANENALLHQLTKLIRTKNK